MPVAPTVRYLTEFHDSARWNGFRFRPDDIIVSPPAKCGTTWLQTICSLLIFRTTELEQPLSIVSPWFEMLTRPRDEVLADLDAQTHRRFVKSHTPLDGLPWDERVTYITIARDPRDVAISRAHHDDNFDDDAFQRARRQVLGADADDVTAPAESSTASTATAIESFWEWIGDPEAPPTASSSFRRMLHHLDTFWRARDRPNVVLLHYADFVDDLDGSMRALARRLDIDIEFDIGEALWPELVRAASFSEMRGRAAQLAPNTDQALFLDPVEFFHRGTNGQWRALLGDDDLTRYRECVRSLVPDDVASWIHHGDW